MTTFTSRDFDNRQFYNNSNFQEFLTVIAKKPRGAVLEFSIKSHLLLGDGAAVPFVESPYVGGPFAATPKIIVMHFTYGGTASSSAHWFRSPDNPGSSAHIIVERDGSVIQCVPFNVVAWHAGKSKLQVGDSLLEGLNQYSIGIEMANWGYLQRTPAGWQSYTQQKIADPVLAAHPYGNPDGSTGPIGWESYPEVQVRAATAIARALVSAYAINMIVGHEDISRGRKWDPGPAFDLKRLRGAVFGGRAEMGSSSFRVTAKEGLNLRDGPSISAKVIKVLPFEARVDVLKRADNWSEVSVLNDTSAPALSGWVNSAYLS